MNLKDYKEQICKIAMARAWKREYGNLSEENQQKLKSKKILNHKKEMEGLNKGTENILKKYNGKIVPAKEFDKTIIGYNKNHDIYKDFNMSSSDLKAQVTNARRGGGGFAGGIDFRKKGPPVMAKGNISKSPIIKNLNETLNRFYKKDIGLKDVKSKTDKKYLSAILTRHEADEIRHATKSINNKKNSIQYKGTTTPITNTNTGHLSPKVIVGESAHAAIAPKSVKNFMTNLRAHGGSDVNLLKEYGRGMEYSKSGVFNNSAGRKITKVIRTFNRPFVKDLLSSLKK